jgi:hypothetical protein
MGRDITLDLVCEARNSPEDEPVITAVSNIPVKIVVRWMGKEKTLYSKLPK